ncbi:MAG: peptide MFS transporter [Bacteroidetes bacterium]|jgi:POT family proton-dependent oligopeptide transporter|nr:peptide MFS transporter [Bacteroidota bacterium]
MANKHPKGLPYLFFAEMWERFGYYLMIGIFVLYLTDTQTGGWGMERSQASDIYGTFIALVFLTPFLGGLLADRVLGYRLSITIGGLLMGAGYCLLAVKGEFAFYTALVLIILGNGFFKPNISTLLGNTYNEDRYLSLKDAGYNIFYMGINIGALICNFFAAALRNNYGWGYAFVAAGIGMFIGVIIFWAGMKHYKHADVLKPAKPEDQPLSRILGLTIVPAVAAGIVGWLIPGSIFGSDSTDAFIFGSLPVAYFYFSLWKKSSPEEKKPIGAMLAIFGVVIIFWAVFKQNGTALTTWAEYYTDREMPAAMVKPAEKLFLVQNVEMKTDSVMLTDEQFRKIKDENEKPIKAIGTPDYFKNVPLAQRPAEGEKLPLISTELFQSVNPFWVVVLTPLVVMFFVFLRKRGKEPTTPAKIGWGLVVSALSTLVMVGAVAYCHNGAEKASPWWLIASYGVITVGELFLSPMGLSLVSKLSPARLTALMMGGWFLSTSIGNKLSGILATMWDKYDNKTYYFLVNFVLLILAAVAIFMMLRWLNRIFKEHKAA